ncbi:hypothetical protein [Candidimonas nitroreducens]|nr:hypothetical protein [Candidimonas nitroreducens]
MEISAMALAHSTRIPVEHRFPLHLRRSITSIRDLYEAGKQQRWNPDTDIAWSRFDPAAYDAAALQAARLTWSRRAWVEYAGLAETPAILIRFCLEAGRESDPKYFLTVRNTEEAWQIESCHRYAGVLGGYVDQPSSVREKTLFNQYRHRHALDAEESADAFFVVHSAVEDSLELELCRAYLDDARDPVARQILEKSTQAKERHAAFGWLYATERAARWSAPERAQVSAQVLAYLRDIELAGYHCAWLGDPASAEARAAQATSEAGLGAASQERERDLLCDYVAAVRARLGELGVDLPELSHPALGRL